jgi:hypothetical protein
MMKVKFDRWPWQNYPTTGWSRFGGGWKYKLGVDIGSGTIIINLILGMIRIDWK